MPELPPNGNRWLTTWTPQEWATLQRTAWDGDLMSGDYYMKASIIDGQATATRFHTELDRELRHTSGDRHGECASQLRVDSNFSLLCAERLSRSQPIKVDAVALARQAERQRAAEAKVQQRLRERLERKYSAENQLLPAPPPGSRLARRRREERLRPAATAEESSRRRQQAHSRWEEQFGGGKACSERLTGNYVHSLDDVGRIERTPAERRMSGRSRLTSVKVTEHFTNSLRGYDPPNASPRLLVDKGSRSSRGTRSGVRL